MTDYPLDTATRLQARDDGCFESAGGAAYWNFQSAFGGWALALALEAARAGNDAPKLVASATAHFMKPLPEAGIILAVRVLREGRRTDFIRVEAGAAGEGAAPLFAADFVFCDPREAALDYTADFPLVAQPQDSALLPSSPGPRWLANYEQRMAVGTPFSAQERPRTVA